MRVRDPIHGTIPVEETEVPVLDSRFFQRLRYIKQLGFGEFAFPGATHTRLAHSLGAMHVASRLFDAAFAAPGGLGERDRERFRRAVRLAALCHDLGHLPLSHASESATPLVRELNLPDWLGGRAEGRARHEHLTARILLDSSMTPILDHALEGTGLTSEALAALILEGGGTPPGGSPYLSGGWDYAPLLKQLIGGEIDGDRMDYLLRDSFYTGVHYGRFDLDWIVQNLSAVPRDGRVYLGLARSAVFAFEDFLLSRFHMFSSVYFHHTAVGFDEMLRRYYAEAEEAFVIPPDPERLIGCDDIALLGALRRSENRWAKRIVARQGYRRICQVTERDPEYDLPAIERALREAGIEVFRCESLALLSRYGEGRQGPPVFVVDRKADTVAQLADYTPLYRRYGQSVRLSRLYCEREHEARATELVVRMVHSVDSAPDSG